MSLIEIFRAGGPVMWPLLVCLILTVAIVIERSINLRGPKILQLPVVERIVGLVEAGRPDRARNACTESPGIFTNIVLAALQSAKRGEWAAKEALEDAGRHETARLSRYLGALGTIAGISPLLGLLGTVTGMIEVFRTIATVGTGQAAQLSSGISQALISTATGLLIAIPSLVAYNFFQMRAGAITNDIESAALRVLRALFEDAEGPSHHAAQRSGSAGTAPAADAALAD
jgi:biopolymer transport protein ExbB